MAQNVDAANLKETFVAQGGIWGPAWETILQADPVYFAAYLKLRSVPMNKKTLPYKTQELVLLAVNASTTTLYEPGIRAHTAAALAAGATRQEIMETLELSSVLGVHATSVGVPCLMEVLQETGVSAQVDPLDERQQHLKADFSAKRGYWSPHWETILRLDPLFFEAYTEFSSVPFRSDRNFLDAKTKELMYCAIDCACTHLYAPGLKTHIRNALRYGATPSEIMEVYNLASLMGIHTVLAGATALAEASATS
ncbi:carboxymuconolactone decarboxylase [Rhizodiscina lignyota]|uniref:Carboxymuconolactone decarboxylase n=1 Tax=Rhizodiscina lignyota TaxID=1504668 RepID=A0A9P4IAJ5_9PEZI|nr:carboxymuconolactone decarboxylase [Rhizodiscina lignyota]